MAELLRDLGKALAGGIVFVEGAFRRWEYLIVKDMLRQGVSDGVKAASSFSSVMEVAFEIPRFARVTGIDLRFALEEQFFVRVVLIKRQRRRDELLEGVETLLDEFGFRAGCRLLRNQFVDAILQDARVTPLHGSGIEFIR